MDEDVNVQVVHLEPERVFRRQLRVPVGTSVMQVIDASGFIREDGVDHVDPTRLGIFSRRVSPDTRVSEGDRIEIYRPLDTDPKDARRRRANPIR